MPVVTKEAPTELRPYLFHGVDLQWCNNDREALGTCPFCNREGKFSVNISTGVYRCFVCAEGTEKGGGNSRVFIRKLWAASDGSYLADISKNRGLLETWNTGHAWGLRKSITTGDWILPGYGPNGEISQLYRYVRVPNGTGWRMILMPTPELGHQLFMPYGAIVGSTIWLCEGPWDGMALWELLGNVKLVDGKVLLTNNPAQSMLANNCVVAISSCGAVGKPLEKFLPLFAGKTVNLCFDNDHPHKNKGKEELPAAYLATRRAVDLLQGHKDPPIGINWLQWGSDGHGWDMAKPGGYDVRDALQGPLQARCKALEGLLGLIRPVPQEWLKTQQTQTKPSDAQSLSCKPCSSYAVLTNAWRRALKWTDGLDHALVVMLASSASTMTLGDQLWFKVVSPPSSGKTTLAEAMAVNEEYVKSVSTLRGMYSGSIDESGEDYSLITQAAGKTLIIKDGDALLQSPNLSQILAEMRDIYDTVGRPSYRNKASRDHKHKRMTMLICGTASLRSLDDSELGERALDCVLMDEIEDDMEDDILWRVANRSAQGLGVEATCKAESNYDPDMLEAMQLTGGYVGWLREHAVDVLSTITISDEAKHLCTRLGKFVAHLRARPSKRQKEDVQREFASRLVSQFTRLAGCLALVLNKPSVDSSVMQRVHRIAMDTSRGVTLKICKYLYHNPVGVPNSIAHITGGTVEDTGKLLRFLQKIHVVETYEIVGPCNGTRIRYRLTSRMVRLWDEVHNA
jgi:hypothetical protein